MRLIKIGIVSKNKIFSVSFSSFNVFHLFLFLLIYLSESGQDWQNYFGTVSKFPDGRDAKEKLGTLTMPLMPSALFQ